MMLLLVVGFVIGIHLTVILFGALYRVIDLAYAWPRYGLANLSRIALFATVIGLIYAFAEGPFLTGFRNAQVFFCVFHIVVFWLGQWAVHRLSKRL